MTELERPSSSDRAGKALRDSLREIVGPAHVLIDPARTQGYTTDWTGRWVGSAVAVVRPGSTAEVSAVVTACSEARVPITTQGGNTGLVGGGIPQAGSVLLSTRRLDLVESVDPIGCTIAAGAGVTVAHADAAASAHGLRFGVDLASRESATLGGIVATNAGGSRMIRFGDTRSQLLGIEAVLADGTVLSRWTPLVRDNVGYDLAGLLAGSEGTLAVITKVLMKLVTPATDSSVFLAGVATVDAALRLSELVARSGLTIEAAELMTADGIDIVCEHTDARRPFESHSRFYVLFEVSALHGTEDALLGIFAAAEGLVHGVAIDRRPARKLWRLRDAHTVSIGRASGTPVIKLDLSVPLESMPSFVEAVESTVAQRFPTTRSIIFGHFADGNIHVNLLDVPSAQADSITEAVFRVVADHGGSISAESGVGRAKTQWLHLGRSAIDVYMMKRIKLVLDPRLSLNPGVLFSW
ncbi:FAD-binding oxidoreductase [Nocardia brasiliensis]|uniref:FAD-binding oxidoreductase n=1 Tax=Nocardia brasiliensis TaxID=37326 RepID=UPI003D8E5CC3